MEKALNRTWTINKIDRSISECLTLEQLASTEQFLNLYYKHFPFDASFFKQEWMLDNQIRSRKKAMVSMDDVDPDTISFGKDKISLQRLNAYVKTLSTNEFQAEWPVLQPQLEGVDVLDVSLYPELCEKIACLRLPTKNQQDKQLQYV